MKSRKYISFNENFKDVDSGTVFFGGVKYGVAKESLDSYFILHNENYICIEKALENIKYKTGGIISWT